VTGATLRLDLLTGSDCRDFIALEAVPQSCSEADCRLELQDVGRVRLEEAADVENRHPLLMQHGTEFDDDYMPRTRCGIICA